MLPARRRSVLSQENTLPTPSYVVCTNAPALPAIRPPKKRLVCVKAKLLLALKPSGGSYRFDEVCVKEGSVIKASFLYHGTSTALSVYPVSLNSRPNQLSWG